MTDRFAANRGADIVQWYKMAAMVDEKQAAARILTDVAAWAKENSVELDAPAAPDNAMSKAVEELKERLRCGPNDEAGIGAYDVLAQLIEATQSERQPDLLPPLNIRNDRDMLNYLSQAFASEMSVCNRCGESESTDHMDSAKFLRDYLAAAK